MDHLGYSNLLRVWNYLPQINDPENGLERYRRFNMGRHESFVLSGRDISDENVPAASALGAVHARCAATAAKVQEFIGRLFNPSRH